MKKRKCIMKNMETGAEDKNQQTAIYVMTHKAFTPPPTRCIFRFMWEERRLCHTAGMRNRPRCLFVWEIIPEITFPKKTVITVN